MQEAINRYKLIEMQAKRAMEEKTVMVELTQPQIEHIICCLEVFLLDGFTSDTQEIRELWELIALLKEKSR